MGNCLQSGRCGGRVLSAEFIKIMKVDGKLLEYKAPLLVKELLVDYEAHAVVNARAVCHRLSPENELVPSELYYLLPSSHFPNDSLCVSSNGNVNADVRHRGPALTKQTGVVDVVNSPERRNGDGVRLRVVLTKRQLEDLLCDDCPKETSLRDLLIKLRSKALTADPSPYKDSAATNISGWRPALESIPEGTDVPCGSRDNFVFT